MAGMSLITIAIDGPSGAGKSTVAKAVAAQLSMTYLDTGAMYRAVALLSSRTGQDPAEIARNFAVELSGSSVLIAGEDVSGLIRTAEISELASQLSARSDVRSALVARQKQLMAEGGFVAEGRDIGTVVAPGAEVKVFLTASPQERARRRAAQSGSDYETVLADQLIRDERDSTRADSPLKPADDAILIESTQLTVEQIVQAICRHALR
jgi:cytidylate kinase